MTRPPNRPSPSVLVVDDIVDAREMLTEYLTFRGFAVSAAADAEEALECARASRPDVILMDLRMPGMGGLEATRRLRADPELRKTLIVAVTAQAFVTDAADAFDAGCDAVVRKPFDLDALATALTSIPRVGASALNRLGWSTASRAPRR